MKLKKKAKLIVIGIILIVIIGIASVAVIKFLPKEENVKEVKVLKSIDEYGYHLKDNKTDKYKTLFKELEDILRAEKVDDEAYAKKVAEMFIYDFYSLNDKAAKTDVGGVEFIHPNAVENFLLNAEDTYYKYVESNIYNERKQELPTVSAVTIDSITPTEYAYNNEKHLGYEVKLSWSYTNEKFADYQKTATVILIKSEIRYYIVEVQ